MKDRSTAGTSITLELPDWIASFLSDAGSEFPSPEDRMRLAIDLARINVKQRTGGPFGAAVFQAATGKLIAAGVNLVEASKLSIAHAEIVVVTSAQASLATSDLSADARHNFELVTSCEPCTMCLGAVCWSGVRSLVCAARDADARAIGFDEGPKPARWDDKLRERGIEVTTDLLRGEAVNVLTEYASAGGLIYGRRKRG